MCPEEIFGYLLNIPSRMHVASIPLPFQGKHWFAVRQIGGVYYDLDSKLAKPRLIGTNVLEYLSALLSREHDAQLLLVVTNSIAETRSWQLTDTSRAS